MKKILLFTSFVFCGVSCFSQIAPNSGLAENNFNRTSPNINKTAYLTNLTGKVVQAYPNPARDQVTVQHVAFANRAVMSVMSADGRVLFQQNVLPNTLQTQFNVGRLSTGMYILKFDDSRGDVRVTQLLKN
ncbi:MAG: T9SS type A sorting domain-containing protein [Ferruginibacter sp.]|nr:T9SS type A sorting domain-containing protein [Ferruginibacter sp.]